jgi:hypothetical protein
MTRDELIHLKTQELDEQLSRWATENQILREGETLSFTFKVVPARWRKGKEVSPREIYDAVLRIKARGESVSMAGVEGELKASVVGNFQCRWHPFRAAYFAAKNGNPFPVENEE